MPSFFTDHRLRIILGVGCLLLAIVNAAFYYRDLAVAAQSKADIHELNKRGVSQTVSSTPTPFIAPSSTPTPSPSIMLSPSPVATVKVPLAATTKPAASLSGSSTASTTGKVKITTATEAEFDTLPGIGPSKAKAIVEYRATKPFTKLEDLKEVSGIGDKTYEGLLPYIEL